jgi:hypothetical protein
VCLVESIPEEDPYDDFWRACRASSASSRVG